MLKYIKIFIKNYKYKKAIIECRWFLRNFCNINDIEMSDEEVVAIVSISCESAAKALRECLLKLEN